jgi:hypothetical protein
MEFGNYSGSDSGAIWVTAVSLIIFGYVYNRIIDRLHRDGFNDGFVWLEVVFGTAVTIGAAGFTIGWANVALVLVYFACSGLFMAIGDIWRHVRARRAENGRD